jgi:hypothetical protein
MLVLLVPIQLEGLALRLRGRVLHVLQVFVLLWVARLWMRIPALQALIALPLDWQLELRVSLDPTALPALMHSFPVPLVPRVAQVLLYAQRVEPVFVLLQEVRLQLQILAQRDIFVHRQQLQVWHRWPVLQAIIALQIKWLVRCALQASIQRVVRQRPLALTLVLQGIVLQREALWHWRIRARLVTGVRRMLHHPLERYALLVIIVRQVQALQRRQRHAL